MKLLNQQSPPSFMDTKFTIEFTGHELARIMKALYKAEIGSSCYDALANLIPESHTAHDRLDNLTWKIKS